MGLALEQHAHGLSLNSLFDTRTGQQLLAAQGEPLFDIVLRHTDTHEEVHLTADVGWHKVRVTLSEPATTVQLRWDTPLDERLGAVQVIARAVADVDTNSLTWQLEVSSSGNAWAVRQLFQGDWFDAAVIYRRWVREHARWYPRPADAGREDTPRWMRDLHVWALGGGDPKSGKPVLQDFAQQMGLAVGFHWYNWHQIPFDNDYPHYFPADDGFAEAVKLLQQKDIHVMPYINGRLWDTHDRGAEDHEFSPT